MSVLSRRSLLAFAAVILCFGSASALPVPSRRDVPKPKPAAAVPGGAHHAPVPPPAVRPPYDGPPPMAVAHAVRTPPLRKMKVIPPPFRSGEDESVQTAHPPCPAATPPENARAGGPTGL